MRTAEAAEARFALFPSMGEYQVYDDHVYDAFDAADDRHRAYRDAIRAVAHGRVVVDIGTGRDALWAIEAAHAGARHVYAIESDDATAGRADEAVAAAGLTDRVTVLPGHSCELTIPVRAEICVSEIVGNIATAEGAIPILNDARLRLCTPDCIWIPFRMQTWAAAVDLSGHADLALADSAVRYLHAIFDSAGGPFDPRLCLAGPAEEVLISSCTAVESVTFETPAPAFFDPDQAPAPAFFDPDQAPAPAPVDAEPRPAGPPADGRSEAELRIAADTTMTGVLLWARVAVSQRGGREVDTLHGDTRAWAPVYVPLPSPLAVTAGEHVTITLARTTSDDGIHPDYELAVDGSVAWRGPHHGGPFRGSDFYRQLFHSS